MARKPSDQVKLNLRFTEALRLRLEKQAAKNNRSMNEEILHRLHESFAKDDMAAFVDKVTGRFTEVLVAADLLKPGTALTVSGVRKADKP
jgi:hypothetical protein